MLAVITVLSTAVGFGSVAAAPAGAADVGRRRDELPFGRDLVTFADVRR